MRFCRSIGPLVLALGILAAPAHAADSPENEGAAVSRPAGPALLILATASDSAKTPAPAAAAPVAAAPAKPARVTSRVPVRRAWMIGLGAGWSTVGFRGAGQRDFAAHPTQAITANTLRVYPTPVFGTSNKDDGINTQFSLAYAIRPDLSVGFRRISWSNGEKDFSKWNIGITAMTATWYPNSSYWYVRAGAGPADINNKPGFTTTFANTGEQLAVVLDQTTYTDYGFGGLVAVGMEWNLFGRICVAPELRAMQATFDKATAAGLMGGGVAVEWWF